MQLTESSVLVFTRLMILKNALKGYVPNYTYPHMD